MKNLHALHTDERSEFMRRCTDRIQARNADRTDRAAAGHYLATAVVIFIFGLSVGAYAASVYLGG